MAERMFENKTPDEIRVILGMRSAEERSRAIFGQDVQLCTAPLPPGEPECRRLAMWQWQPDPADHPVFLCHAHAEPFYPHHPVPEGGSDG